MCCGHFNLSANAGCMCLLYSGKTRQKDSPKEFVTPIDRLSILVYCKLVNFYLAYELFISRMLYFANFSNMSHIPGTVVGVMRDAKICKSVLMKILLSKIIFEFDLLQVSCQLNF